MKVKIFGANGQFHEYEVELEGIKSADIEVWDGAEVMHVEYDWGTKILQYDDIYTFKHGFWRVWDEHHYDGGYPVYDAKTGFNLFADDKWMNDTSAYNRMI